MLVHGAGSGPWIFEGWEAYFPGLEVKAVDLQAGLAVEDASMEDYAGNVVRACRSLSTPVSLCGWSMGGLVVLMAAADLKPHSVILIEPSPPAEIQGRPEEVTPRPGAFDPQQVYGPFPPGVPSRLESGLARAQRKRGISVPVLGCPSLVVCGRDCRDERGPAVARLYGSDLVELPALDHWGLVLQDEPRQEISSFLGLADRRSPPGG
ncbi:MAG TPA: alpha/beta hydrolase [Actinomycetota bacterium]|nr:alpha/beta hydrolase [Actinomycetota bacterium]